MRLVVSDLSCIRGGRIVLSGLTFSVAGGGALVVTGPNGSGKSTLLRALAGLLRSNGGRVVLEGGEPELTLPDQSHYLGHLDPVKPALTVRENLAFWTGYYGAGEHNADALIEVGLADLDDLPGAYLSAGQRRRLSLARLIAVTRPVWLLDEPTSTLDAAGQDRFRDLVRGHQVAGGIVVAATHAPLGIDGAQELPLGDRG